MQPELNHDAMVCLLLPVVLLQNMMPTSVHCSRGVACHTFAKHDATVNSL